MACRRDINAIKRRSRGVVRSRWSSRSGCGSSWSAIILLVILLQGGLETLAADDAPARATSATSSQSDIADERPPSVENPFEKISSKWKDILPIDRACLSLIDWWVSQPLFSYLDKPQTYPNFDAFPMQWATYDNIQKRSQRYERMTRNRKDLRKHGGGQLLTEEYDDGTRQGFAVDGEYMILPTYEHIFVDDVKVSDDGRILRVDGEKAPYQSSAPTTTSSSGSFGGQSDPSSLDNMRKNIGRPVWVVQTHKPVHQDFCFRVLKNLLDLLAHFSDPQALGWQIQVHRDMQGELINFQDVNDIVRRVQDDLTKLTMLTAVRFDEVQGIQPQILKPVFATLAHVARVRRNIKFQRCVASLRAEDQEGGGAVEDVVLDGDEEGLSTLIVEDNDLDSSPKVETNSSLQTLETGHNESATGVVEMKRSLGTIRDVDAYEKFLLQTKDRWRTEKEKGVLSLGGEIGENADTVLLRSGRRIKRSEQTAYSRLFGGKSERTKSKRINPKTGKLWTKPEAIRRLLAAALQGAARHGVLDQHDASPFRRTFGRGLRRRGLEFLFRRNEHFDEKRENPEEFMLLAKGDTHYNAFRSIQWSYLEFATQDLVEETYENCHAQTRTKLHVSEEELFSTPVVKTTTRTSSSQEEEAFKKEDSDADHSSTAEKSMLPMAEVYADTCCHLLERAEGDMLADAWGAYVESRRMNRGLVHRFYREPHKRWLSSPPKAAFYNPVPGLGKHLGPIPVVYQPKSPSSPLLNHTAGMHNLLGSRVDMVLMHHLESGTEDLAGGITLLKNELQLNYADDIRLVESNYRKMVRSAEGGRGGLTNKEEDHIRNYYKTILELEALDVPPSPIPTLHRWLESPLFAMLERHALPRKLKDIPVSHHEVQNYLYTHGAKPPRVVPFFYVLPTRDLIADSVRRMHALDCPIAKIMEEHRAQTDLFLEVGGFFGDCIVGATISGWARYGVIELDGSVPAIKVLNKTIDSLFLKTRTHVPAFPSNDYVFAHDVSHETVRTLREEDYENSTTTRRPSADEDAGEQHEATSTSTSPSSESTSISSGAPTPTTTSMLTKPPFAAELNALTSGKFLIRAAAMFVSDRSGWFRPAARRKLVSSGRNVAEEFAQGANSFSGLTSWQPCQGEEYQDEMDRILGGSKDTAAPAAGINTKAQVLLPSRRSCVLFETVDGFLDKIIYPNFFRLHQGRFPVSEEEFGVRSRGQEVGGVASTPLSGPATPRYAEDFLQQGILRVGVRIKVSGTEHDVIRGMKETLKNVYWLHVAIMPECFCEAEIMRIMTGQEDKNQMKEVDPDDAHNKHVVQHDPALYNFEVVSRIQNNFKEVLILFRKRKRGTAP